MTLNVGKVILLCAWMMSAPATAELPSGNDGIAANYPNDRGIDVDPRVVFAENFNDPLTTIKRRWESIKDDGTLSISPDRSEYSHGPTSLLVTHVGGQGSGAHLYRRLEPGFDRLHYRFYVKFDANCAPIHHFFHVGGYHPATAWPQGGAGTRPRGNERFTTGVEPFGQAWQWDYYSYWMRMRGSPPRGQCWGNSFLHDPSAKVTKGQWQCLELMMQVNDFDKSNGQMALWLDGKLMSHLGEGFPRGKWVFDRFVTGKGGDGVRWNDDQKQRESLAFAPGGDPFEGFRWRSDEKLKLNFLWLLCYITKAKPNQVSKIWFDDIVVATEYIGPIKDKSVR